jgi:hypothetical protein
MINKHPFIKVVLFILLGLPFTKAMSTEPSNPPRIKNSKINLYSVNIMDNGQCTALELSNMILFYNPVLNPEKAELLAKIYVDESVKEGVNQDIAFSQMCLETGFLNFGGSVLPEQNNFCGLGATNKNTKGESFPDMLTGIRAHIQHLKAYASTHDLYHELVDMRFRFVSRGSAQTIYDLPGKWAADKDYAIKLEDLLNRLFLLKSQNFQSETDLLVQKSGFAN